MPAKKKIVKKATKKKKFVESKIASATQILLAVLIGGVVASTAVAVFARSVTYYERVIYPLIDDTFVRINKPTTGDVVNGSLDFEILAMSARGIDRVEIYEHSSLPTDPVAILPGPGPYFRTKLKIVDPQDHSFKVYYAKAYGSNGTVETSTFTHVQIDKCFAGALCTKVHTGDDGVATMHQDITVEQGARYNLSFRAKRGSEDSIKLEVMSQDETQVYTSCSFDLLASEWLPSSECTYFATTDNARLKFTVGEEGNAQQDTFLYIDDVHATHMVHQVDAVQNGDFSNAFTSWSGDEVSTTQITPTTTIKPFAPTQIYSVDSNIEINQNHQIGFWFFKGWPQSHYSWWTKLGQYERPPISYDPLGEYTYLQYAQDHMGWYSPLTMWVSRETTNSEDFSFEDVKLTVLSDKGKLDICVPDLDWDSPLLNGFQITGLMVDEHGNTYYNHRTVDPDALQNSNIAGRCACSDGTKVNQCNSRGTLFCNEDGTLSSADCRTCGCSFPREECKEQDNGSYSCETEITPVEVDIVR